MYVATLRTRKLSKVILSLLLPSIGLAAFGAANASTFYVRADGGDASQCNGRADAAYPGSGTAQNCAWKNPNIALPNSGSARIAGGDTLLIGSGSYQIGSGGYMQAIPSGTSSTAKTRILGNGATAPKLIGIGGIHRVLNLDGSSNVEIGNLEVTDGSDCVYNHSQAAALCTSTMPWARVGLYARSSSNVWLHDLNIHGMAKNGVNAGGLTNWTIERFKINKNGAAGWDGNIGTVAPNAGQMILRNIEVAFNGCGEKVSTGEPWACWAQQTGGYGDGFGTTDTGGQWLVEDAFVHHNTSDGLDFRYMDGADTTTVTMRRVYSVANAGNQVKIKGNSLIENSVLVGQCTYFRGKDYMTEGDLCRAYGSSLLLILTGNDVATVRHNTIAGEGDAQIAYGEGASTDKVIVQNNLVVGFPYYANTASNTLFAGGSAPAVKTFSGNMGWNAKSCPSGSTCTQNPTLKNMTLASFDAEPLDGSPVIDKAPMISAVTTDFVMGQRPAGAANDVGAYEKQAAVVPPPPPPPPAPVCTTAAPTLTMTGPTAAVAAGTSNTYSLTLKNNDSSACTNTSFALARSVPSGWTGTLSASALDLAPGASATATLVVVSSTSAAAGSYGLGVGSSSAAGSVHTQSASATYAVAAPAPVPPPVVAPITETVSTDKATYRTGEVVSISARVLQNSAAVAGATVSFKVTKVNGGSVVLSGTTDSSGYARVSYKTARGQGGAGSYQLVADATSGSQTAKATSTFSVSK
ncbi:NEW3 domain-containing protein [Lysobacter tyrosinilyticus]